MSKVRITRFEDFEAAFGNFGAKAGSRVGPSKRTQDEEEWFVLRRVMAHTLGKELFDFPVLFEKVQPPNPDFAVRYGEADQKALVEITEATHPSDQREMTKFAESEQNVSLLGEFGGRFADGASQPKFVWASDVLDAIARKQRKPICTELTGERHLIVYPNSNASMLLFDEADEREAFAHLRFAASEKGDRYIQAMNGCKVHVLGKELVCIDLFGSFRLIKRNVVSSDAICSDGQND
jgi:hypothetical protein